MFQLIDSVLSNQSLAHILVAALFIITGIRGLFFGFSGFKGMIASKGLPFPAALAVFVLLLKIFGGLSIARQDKYKKLSSFLLTGFMIIATALFHATPGELNNALKNISIIGALMMIYTH